tara:strand:+ start:64 stop:243 length:180 start_codon:yes stop_codon:yes gene_type:complete
MSDWMKGLIDAEEDWVTLGMVVCREKALYNTKAMMSHDYSDGYFSYVTSKLERGWGVDL